MRCRGSRWVFRQHYNVVEYVVDVVRYLVEPDVDVVVVSFLVGPTIDVSVGSDVVVVAAVGTCAVVAGLMLGKRLALLMYWGWRINMSKIR